MTKESEEPMSTNRTETAVRQRYAGAARATEAALCCPVEYDRKHLAAIPPEVIEKDYGCGDPSRYLRAGEMVLDLGSGTGKICFIAAQVVGPTGKVIGVDMTDEMLAVARRNAPIVAERVGYANGEFRKGLIQDLALDLELVGRWLSEHPVADAEAYLNLKSEIENLKFTHPLVASDSIDVVVSNCVLNHRLRRGERVAVCDKTCQLYKKPPYREYFEFVDPVTEIPLEQAKPFDCSRTTLRLPRETKGQDYNVTTAASSCCDGGNGACC